MFGNKTGANGYYDPDNFAGYDDMTGQSIMPEKLGGIAVGEIRVGEGGSPFRVIDEFLAKNNPKEVFSDAWTEAQTTSNPERTFAKFLHHWKLDMAKEFGVTSRLATDEAGTILKDARGIPITEFTSANRMTADQVAHFVKDPEGVNGVKVFLNKPSAPLTTPDVRLGGVAVKAAAEAASDRVVETTTGPKLNLETLEKMVRERTSWGGSSSEAVRTGAEAGAVNVHSVTEVTGAENVGVKSTVEASPAATVAPAAVEQASTLAQNFDGNIRSFLKPGLSFDEAAQNAWTSGRYSTLQMAKGNLQGMLRQIAANQAIVTESSNVGTDPSQALAKIKATKEAIRAWYGDVLAE
jgi:hypothetical protein